MARQEFKPDTHRFFSKGLFLNAPVDMIPEGGYPILKNVRSYQQGRIEPRPGFTVVSPTAPMGGDVVSGQSPVHSARRLQGSATTWARVVGTGTHLAVGQQSFADVDSGYSGDPLSLVPAVPQGSPSPWVYVGDRSRMRKVSDSGTVRKVGLPPPTEPPTVTLDAPNYDLFNNTEALTGWANAGTAGALFLVGYRVSQSITAIAFDSGTTGWASIGTALAYLDSAIRAGMHLQLDPGGTHDEFVIAESVHPAVATSTIAGIIYDSGTTGACVIALADPGDDYVVDSLIKIDTEVVRVVSVTPGPDGSNSFRCVTTSNHVVGETVTGIGSVRAYCKKTHIVTETVRANAIRSDITAGLGYVQLTQPVNLNRHLDDIIHVSVKFSDISKVTEGKILFDVDSGTNDFAHNFYFLAFHPSDLVPAVAEAKTIAEARTNAVTRYGDSKPLRDTQVVVSPTVRPGSPADVRGTLDPVSPGPLPSQSQVSVSGDLVPNPRVVPGPPFGTIRTVLDPGSGRPVAATTPRATETSSAWSDFATSREIAPGSDQWLELRFTLRDLIRVGSDSSRNLGNVAKIRIQLTVTATVTLSFSSLWILRGPGPEVGDVGAPYVYRYRCRHRDTGVRSNFSPVSRGEVSPHRTPVLVTLPYVSDSDVSHLDVERFGGDLLGWRYVGTAENVVGGSVLHDTLSDDVVAASASEGNMNFQLWPTIGTAVSGTANVVGPVVLDSGTGFNTAWAPGTTIEISGKQYTIDRVISTSRLELVETAPTASAVAWSVQAPVIQGQPLPALWGPLDGFLFGCGDPANPGTLYCSNGNNPDSTQENHKVEVTPATEPLQNGCVYNGRAYVWSTERMFQILRDPVTGLPLLPFEIPNARGLYSRWAFAVGPSIYWLARDGIYETQGGAPRSLTDAALYPLFPHEGQDGQAVNGYSPPDLPVRASITDQPPRLRLAYYEDWLYFDYKARDTTQATLAYQTDAGAWYWDQYTPAAYMHYGEEGQGVRSLLLGGSDGKLYQSGGSDDNLVAISCQVRTASKDQGSPRNIKVYGDAIVDAEAGVIAGVSLTVTPGFDNHSRLLTARTFSLGIRGQTVLELSDTNDNGEAPQARNVSLDLTFTAVSGYPWLYLWEPRYLAYPEATGKRATDWDDAGHPGAKWVQGLIIEADTRATLDSGAWLNTPRTIQVQGDGGVAMAALTVTHPRRTEKAYSFPGFFTHQMRLVPLDSGLWREFTVRWVWQPAPELAIVWETPDTTGNGRGFQHLRDGWIAHISTADITWRVTYDGVAYSYTIPSSGGRYVKTYVPLRAVKHKGRRHKLSSSCPFRLYAEDSEVRTRDWGSTGSYRVERPFGGASGSGAQV